MNKTIKLAVAGAVLSAATVANAGIIIPAGEWTIDINGNVNSFVSFIDVDKQATIVGGRSGGADGLGETTNTTFGTGLLPSWLGFTGTTRQNDLDVSWTISFQPNTSENTATGDGALSSNSGDGSSFQAETALNRQTFLTFGDKSWGSVKIGKDLGIFASDAILNDMTLLGVGSHVYNTSGMGDNTTLGGIGTGYIYAAWKSQLAYTTPDMNGFQATIAITNPQQFNNGLYGTSNFQDRPGIEAKAHKTFTAGSATGKVWVSGASYDQTASATSSYTADVFDIGANINVGNLGLTGYYYAGEGVGHTFMGFQGVSATGTKRDSDGGYVQATYVIPTGTKLGVAYGVSTLDYADATDRAAVANLVENNNRWTVGAYHPLTKHLNLVAEYNSTEAESHNGLSAQTDTVSLGAILFF